MCPSEKPDEIFWSGTAMRVAFQFNRNKTDSTLKNWAANHNAKQSKLSHTMF